MTDTKREAAIEILANCAAHFVAGPQEQIDRAINNATKILDRLRQPSGSGRELSAKEKESLRQVLLTTWRDSVEGSDEALGESKSTIEAIAPHISRLLVACEALAVAGAYLDAAEECDAAQRYGKPEWNAWVCALGDAIRKRATAARPARRRKHGSK